MKTTLHSIHRAWSFLALAAFAITPTHAETIIYADDFSGDSSDLNQLAPDVRPGTEIWTAAPTFNADGTVDRPESTNQGSMTLPFVPQNGIVYNLDASFSEIAGDIDWLALGFANGQSSDSISDRFITDEVVGIPWMLIRGDASVNGNQTHLGTGILGPGNGGIGPSPWTALTNQSGGAIDLRITLDTTGGAGTWTATWFAKLPASEIYSEVRATQLVGNEENFTSIGIAASNTDSENGTGGTIESFSLTALDGASPSPKIINIETDTDGNVILTLDGEAEGLIAQRSNDLSEFTDVAAIAESNTLTIEVGDVDPNADGTDFFRVRN